MKKLMFVFVLFFSFILCSGQILKPVTINEFVIKKGTVTLKAANTDTLLKSKLILRLNTGLMGVGYPLKKGSSPIALNAVCFGLGLLHYKPVNNEPFNDFGINLLFLKNTQDNGYGLGIYGTYNTGLAGNLGLLNLGTHYDFVLKLMLIDTGLTFHF
jgi:hypothetical protein